MNDPRDRPRAIVYGGGGHGRTLIDLVRATGSLELVGVVDDGLSAGVAGLELLGDRSVLDRLRADGVELAVNGVGGVGRIRDRIEVFERLTAAGYVCPHLVHPSAVVEPTAELDAGCQVLAQAYVGTDARIGSGAIVNTGAVISHDCVLGEHVIVSPGALLAGHARVADRSLVGMGATVNIEVRIGTDARVGNGATVVGDVDDHAVVRAGQRWPG